MDEERKPEDEDGKRLREFAPLSHFLSRIPPKAQKGLSTLPLNLTCVAAAEQYLAVGTNVGLVYWFNRTTLQLDRLKMENTSCSITTLGVLSGPDILVGVGNAEGQLSVFQVPKEGKIRSFHLTRLHRCKISALEFSSNGLKLFSGDIGGGVALTELHFDTGTSHTQSLLQEEGEIVQLSYRRKHLLICSTLQSVIYVLSTTKAVRVGSQERKIRGQFGGLFRKVPLTQDLSLYSARPGGRLWVADTAGQVQHTIKFKDLLLHSNHTSNIPLLSPSPSKGPSSSFALTDFQIGRLLPFSTSSLLTYNPKSLYIVDPVNTAILFVCTELKGILDVSVNQDTQEIFVLESTRNLIRLSASPDTFPTNSSISQDLFRHSNSSFLKGLHPLTLKSDLRGLEAPLTQLLSSTLKETSKFVGPVQASLIQGLRQVFEGDINDGVTTTSIPLPPPDTYAQVAGEEVEEILQGIDKFGHISHLPFDDVIIAQVQVPSAITSKRKKTKKKKKWKGIGNGGAVDFQSSMSLSNSTYSTTTGSADEGEVVQGQLSNGWKRKLSQGAERTEEWTVHANEKTLKGNWGELPMSQSWSVGQQEDDSDLKSKEEILAKRLNWPELLHDGYKRSAASLGPVFIQYPSIEEIQLSTTPTTTPTPQSDDEDEEVTLVKDPESLTSLDESLDIYTKYRGKEIEDETPPLSFGPPSSASNGSGQFPLSLSNLQPRIIEIDEGTLSSSSSNGAESPTTTPKGIVIGPLRDMVVEPVPLLDQNDAWVSFTFPGTLDSIVTSNSFLMGVDRRKRVYITYLGQQFPLDSLRWVESKWKADAVAVSGNGSLTWRLYRGMLYSTKGVALQAPTWTKLMGDVASISLSSYDDEVAGVVGWVGKMDGTIWSLTSRDGDEEWVRLITPTPMLKIVGGGHKLWGLSMDGRLFFSDGGAWVVVEMADVDFLLSLGLGPSNSVWVGDAEQALYFVEHGKRQVWRVGLGDYFSTSEGGCGSGSEESNSGGSINSGFSLTSIRNKFTDSLRPGRLTSLISKNTNGHHQHSSIIAATCSTLWFGLRGSNKLHLNQSIVTGHRWDYVHLNRRGAYSSLWKNILGGSIYGEVGVLWLVDERGKLFYLPPEGEEDPKAIDLPTSNTLAAVVPAPDALWILTVEGIIFARKDVSSKTPQGHGWERIDLSSQENFHLTHVSCGSDIAWGCDKLGKVFFRVGSLRPRPKGDMSPPWVEVEDDIPQKQQSITFSKIYVGTNGSMVWGLDYRNNIYVREAVFPDFPIGTKWLLVSGVEAVALALSESSVWVLSPSGNIFRRFGISSTNFVGDYWKKVPVPGGNNMVDLTVSLCDQVWSLDKNGGLHKHCATTVNLQENRRRPQSSRQRTELDPEDRDWELIESLDLI